jgi:uncharacterized membrane protein YhaH (DUF805 family)
MKDLFTSNGRIPRSKFWAVIGCFYGLCVLIALIDKHVPMPEFAKAIFGLLIFPVVIVAIIAQVKRWHDRDKSGWWVFINLVPVIGGLWCLIECGCLRGTEGPNRFGNDPLQ